MAAILEALGALGFNPSTFLIEAINVVLVLAALYFILWKPLQKSFADREDQIKGDLEKAASARKEAEEIMAGYQQKIDEANREAQAILEKAAVMAEATRTEIVSRAQAEAAQIMEQARAEIEKETQEALQDIRRQASELIVAAASKAMARSLTPSVQEHLVREALAEVERIQ